MGGAASAVQGAAGVSSVLGGGKNAPNAPLGNVGYPFVPEPEQPPMPGWEPPEGMEWYWDEDAQDWRLRELEDADDIKHQNDLFSMYQLTLQQFGITGADDFLAQAVREDWNESTFLIKLRQQDFYLANPLFAANIANSQGGGRFMAEGEVIAYGAEAKRLARQFGFQEPSDNYIAFGLSGNLSMAEIEHRFAVQNRINQFGGGVSMVYQALMNDDPSDEDLFRIFDKEMATQEFDDKARAAEMRGRPLLLGLGIRPEDEQRSLDLLGVTADRAWAGYQQLAQALPSISRLAAIDQRIANDPDNPFDSFGALFADIFNPGSEAGNKAREDILLKMAREAARFRQGSGAVASQTGQQLGLLSGTERQTF